MLLLAHSSANARLVCNLPADADLLIRLARLVRADADRYLAVQSLEEVQQLIGGKPTEMPVHQVRDFRLLDPKQGSDLPLRQLLGFEDLIDMKADFGACEQLVAFLESQVSKDVAGAFLEGGLRPVVIPHVGPTPLLPLNAAWFALVASCLAGEIGDSGANGLGNLLKGLVARPEGGHRSAVLRYGLEPCEWGLLPFTLFEDHRG